MSGPFRATVFLKVPCQQIWFCLRSTSPREFFFPPEIDSHIAIEPGLGDCTVIDTRQSILYHENGAPNKTGCTVDLECNKTCDETVISELLKSKRWRFVPGSTFVYRADGSVDQEFTEKIRERYASRTHSHA